MYVQVEKPKENKGRAVANSIAQKKGDVKQGFGIVDYRPLSIHWLKSLIKGQSNLKQNANNGEGVIQQKIKGDPNWATFKTWAGNNGFKEDDLGGTAENGKGTFDAIESKGYTYEKLATANAIRYQVRDSTINVDNLLDVLDKEAAGGHGWIRHGSDVTDEELKERLTGKKDRNGAEADTMGQPSSKFKDLASYKKMLDRSETILETKIKKSITDLKPKIVKYESDKKNFQSAPKNTREKTDKNTIMDTSKQAMETEIASLENDHIEFDKNPQQPNQVKLSKKYSIEQQDSDNLAKAFTPGTTLALDTNDYKFAYTKWIGMPGTKVQDLNDGDESSQSHKMETNFPEKAAINSGRLNKVTKAG